MDNRAAPGLAGYQSCVTLPRMLLLAVVLTAGTVGTATALAPVRQDVAPAHERPAPGPAAILHAWDHRRAEAWAVGDPSALRPLYTSGSAAGRADRSMLGAWAARGFHVEGLRTQLLAVTVEVASADRLVLVVTDRLAGGTAVGHGVRRPLPRDRASTHVVALRRTAGQWRVASVRDQASPDRTTS